VILKVLYFVSFFAASLSHHALSAQPQQLLGQPQVAQQLILANPGLTQNQNSGLSVQQLLIPVSAANGTQQLLSLPISLAAGAGGQIQLLTTSNGQLLATNLASLAQPNVVAMANAGEDA
jgi:class 6 POU domain transcription factor